MIYVLFAINGTREEKLEPLVFGENLSKDLRDLAHMRRSTHEGSPSIQLQHKTALSKEQNN